MIRGLKKETKEIPLPSPASKEYWEDSNWALEHSSEISRKYPNQWVAIADKKVVAAGKDGSEVERMATEKMGKREFVIIFAEKEIHVYQSQS